jgi:molybdopterin-synthase adenylyltransferase
VGGRAQRTRARPPARQDRYRLKRSLQPVSASDGALYVLRSGAGDDFILPAPSPAERAAIQLLAERDYAESDLRAELAARGLALSNLGGALDDLRTLGLTEQLPERPLLSKRTRQRYDRQLIYFADLAPPGISAERMQERLGKATVMVLGCGGLGSWAASALACAGVGRLLLVDDDRVELSNLHRQPLFDQRSIGCSKVDAAARRLRRNSPHLSFVPIRRRVRQPHDLDDLLPAADFVVATADWPPVDLPRWVNERCLAHGTPYISGGQFLPLVRIGPLVLPGQGACHECLERQARRDYPLYDELTEARKATAPAAATIGAASGLVGSVIAMEVIHFLTGGSVPPTLSSALILDLRTMELTRERIERDPLCQACQPSRRPGARMPTPSTEEPRIPEATGVERLELCAVLPKGIETIAA